MGSISTRIAALTTFLVVVSALEEAATKAWNGAPFFTTAIHNWIVPPPLSPISKRVENAREQARQAASAARAIANTYPSEAVQAALGSVDNAVSQVTTPQTYPNAKYWGELNNGRIFGYGRLVYNDGSVSEGQFTNEKLNGYGCMNDSKQKIIGQKSCGLYHDNYVIGAHEDLLFKNGVLIQRKTFEVSSGYAVTVFPVDAPGAPAGTRYEGQVKENARNGYGVAYYPDGTRYEGQWVDRRPDGFGAKISSDGKLQAGIWEAGDLTDKQ